MGWQYALTTMHIFPIQVSLGHGQWCRSIFVRRPDMVESSKVNPDLGISSFSSYDIPASSLATVLQQPSYRRLVITKIKKFQKHQDFYL